MEPHILYISEIDVIFLPPSIFVMERARPVEGYTIRELIEYIYVTIWEPK